MEQASIFDNDQPCVHCLTCFCRLRPCCEAQGVKCCRACPYFKTCSAQKCEWLTPTVE